MRKEINFQAVLRSPVIHLAIIVVKPFRRYPTRGVGLILLRQVVSSISGRVLVYDEGEEYTMSEYIILYTGV